MSDITCLRPNFGGDPPSRFEKILHAFRPILNHDLPNLVIALTGLLQMLELETKDLSEEGRDYLARLKSVTKQIQSRLEQLKTVNKVNAVQEGPARISLEELFKEAIAAVKSTPVDNGTEPGATYPGLTIRVSSIVIPGSQTPSVSKISLTTYPTLLRKAFAEIFILLFPGLSKNCLEVSIQKDQGWLELVFSDSPNQGNSSLSLNKTSPIDVPSQTTNPSTEEMKWDILGAPNSLRLLLVEELVCACEGQLQVWVNPQGKRFEVRLPDSVSSNS